MTNQTANKPNTNLAELRGQKSQAPSKTKGLLDLLNNDKVAKGLAAVATQYMSADRMLRLAVYAARKQPKLLECDPQTVLGALMTATALGLEPNTELRQAYLIPYRNRRNIAGQWRDVYECQFQIGYPGYIALSYRSPTVLTLEAAAIREGDYFEHMQGSESFLRYSKALSDRGDLIGAFCFTRLAGGEAATVLPAEEVIKIRERSETYKSLRNRLEEADGKNKKDYEKALRNWEETPWNAWEDGMWAKSAIKAHCRSRLPLTAQDPLTLATSIEAKAESGVLDMAQMTDPDQMRAIIEGAPLPEHEPVEGADEGESEPAAEGQQNDAKA